MVMFSLFPSGVLQVWDVVQHGYWHARSLDYIGSERSHLIEWLRLPGDLVFIYLWRDSPGDCINQGLFGRTLARRAGHRMTSHSCGLPAEGMRSSLT